MQDRVGAMFERNGLVYAPNPDVVPNSQLALRLTELARDQGLHEPVHDRLMDAYWTEGRNIGDPAVLRELTDEAGLTETEQVFEGDAYLDRIAASTAEAQSIGINGIPAFLLDGRLLVLGAQPREAFDQAFAQLQQA
jgi:predicted DsbA family dithiol-disulfide isomerase